MPAVAAGSGQSAEEAGAFGAAGVGTGIDLLAELARLRECVTGLAEVLREVQALYNAHTHVETGAVTAAPPVGQQSATAVNLY